MAKTKVNVMKIIQGSGAIEIFRKNEGEFELEYRLDCNKLIERIKEDKIDATCLANIIAEYIYDCLNCKTASASLHDLDNREQYSEFGTYFAQIDVLE